MAIIVNRSRRETWNTARLKSERIMVQEGGLLIRDISQRRFSKIKLYPPGRILHITRRKKTKTERKAGTGGPSYEMRWAVAEEFMELKVMPRMLLDHLPENVYQSIDTILNEQIRDELTEIT